MKKAVAKKHYTAQDVHAVSDNPEWTKDDFARAKTFDEVFPGMRRGRGPNKAPTKRQVTLRLSSAVVDYFKAEGPGWQSRIDEVLVKVVKRKRNSAAG